MDEARVKKASLTAGAALALTGLATLFLAFWSFSAHLKAPFQKLNSPSKATLSDSELTMEELLRDRQDTDQDGLTDISELQVYGTSPYLPDSDSDGLSDRAEIETGTNPTCPEGRNCQAWALPSVKEIQRQGLQKNLYQLTGLEDVLTKRISGFESQENRTSKTLTAQEIRTLLLKNGMDQDLLAKFEDATLLEAYQATLNEVQIKK